MKVRNHKALAPFKGYVVKELNLAPIGAEIKLEFDRRIGPRCPECSARIPKNKSSRRVVMDRPMTHGDLVYLIFPVAQGYCDQCERYVTTCPEEVHPTCKATWRLMQLISSWASIASNSEVAAMFAISDATVRRYDKIILEKETPPLCFDNVKKLLIDEKSVRKGHHYVTVILDGETGELLHMREGKKKEAVVEFFQKLTPEQRAGIIAVGIDRAGSYQAAIEEWLPDADIVYDRFHLVMNVNQAVDEVRREVCRNLKGAELSGIKGKRFIILANPENLDKPGEEKLIALLEKNQPLQIAWLLKEQFRAIFRHGEIEQAKTALSEWIEMAQASELAPFQRLAKSFRRQIDRVCAFVKHGLTSGLIEGFNNLIARVVHMACGVRDLNYLWLKLRHRSVMRS